MNTTLNRISKAIFVIGIGILMSCFCISYASGTTTNSAIGYVNSSDGLNIRSGPGTSYSRVRAIGNNTKVTILSEHFTSSDSSASSIWYKIQYSSSTGYVRSDYIDGVSYSSVTGKTTDALNYRSGPSTSHTRLGTADNNTNLVAYLSAYRTGSSVTWYKVTINGKSAYVCSTWVKLADSIFETPDDSSTDSGSTDSGSTDSGSTDSGSTGDVSTSFEEQLAKFPESYKAQLTALHEAHPNWVFIADETGLDFNTVVTKESKNGVSLIESSWPISWRATDANSFTAGDSLTLYSKPGSGATSVTVANQESFTLLSEVWSGSTQWNYIKTASGEKGYVKGNLYTQEYNVKMTGTVNDNDVSVRSGGSTSNTWLTQYNKGTNVEIVLQVSDGSNTWYKIKYGEGYAYIYAQFVDVQAGSATGTTVVEKEVFSENYGVATVNDTTEYKVLSNSNFSRLGYLAKGEQYPILGQYKDSDTVWYKLYVDGKAVYAKGSNLSVSGNIASLDAPILDSTFLRAGAENSSSLQAVISAVGSVKIKDVMTNDDGTWYVVDFEGVDVYINEKYIGYNVPDAPADAKPQIVTETVSVPSSTTPADLTATGSIINGTYIAKDGNSWYNADSKTVAYFLDPRNFLNEDRIYMFEDLSYHGDYQTEEVVNKVLQGTALASNGFQASWFCEAGAKYGISPVSVAARARQETGGGSIAITGYVMNGKTVYNPFNIGAYSSSNPVLLGLQYAYDKGWYTKQASVEGGSQFLASGYINAGQNSVYYQRFNTSNGLNSVGTHQYMTNVRAAYDESLTTKSTYSAYGITNEALTFVIPVYSGLSDSNSLPG